MTQEDIVSAMRMITRVSRIDVFHPDIQQAFGEGLRALGFLEDIAKTTPWDHLEVLQKLGQWNRIYHRAQDIYGNGGTARDVLSYFEWYAPWEETSYDYPFTGEEIEENPT